VPCPKTLNRRFVFESRILYASEFDPNGSFAKLSSNTTPPMSGLSHWLANDFLTWSTSASSLSNPK
jgi:hypothetical protein